MEHSTITGFAAILCIYSIWEFFMRRAFFKSSDPLNPSDPTNKRLIANGVILISMLTIGTSGFISVILLVGYGIVAAGVVIWDIVMRKYKSSRRILELFISKQITVFFIFLVLLTVIKPSEMHIWYEKLGIFIFFEFDYPGDGIWNNATCVFMIIAGYCFNIDGGTKFVRGILSKFPILYHNVLNKFDSNKNNTAAQTESEENVGEWIGIIERLIIFTFVLTGQYTAIAFIITAKSIARFKELETKEFSEYYLLGTSGSILVALFSGLFVRLIFCS